MRNNSKLLDLGLYAGSAVLTAVGLSLMKAEVGLRFSGDIGTALAGLDLVTLALMAAAVVIYLLGLGLWLAAMSRNPLSTAYPIGIGTSLVGSTLAAILVVGEAATVQKLAGLALIVAGGICISKGTGKSS